MTNTESPSQIVYHKKARQLVVTFGTTQWTLEAELLRVYSPSAEVRGHGGNTAKLQTGKKQVSIDAVEPVGNYAVKLTFSDGHDTGIYSWAYLQDLGANGDAYWTSYLEEVKAAGASRLPTIPLARAPTSEAERISTIPVGHWKPGE